MTECERIICENPELKDFLNEEIRNDYKVTAEIKKVWLIEIDLLTRFQKLCMEHGLTYWVAFGTLLGATRHQGFIPWDDDLDVWLPRDDYNKLIKLSNDELEEPYFLQTTLNDDDYYSAFARLRNSNTTGILVSPNNNCNNGIYIDIYPVDALNKTKVGQFIRSKWIYVQNVMAHAYTFNINPNPITRAASKILRMKIMHYDQRRVYKKVDKLAGKISWNDTNKVGNVVFSAYSYNRNNFDKVDFSDTVYLPFEHLQVPVPVGYKNILSILYRDYMTFPPVEKRGLWHNFTFEPDVPYTEYIKKRG